jgi:hypothetical protein
MLHCSLSLMTSSFAPETMFLRSLGVAASRNAWYAMTYDSSQYASSRLAQIICASGCSVTAFVPQLKLGPIALVEREETVGAAATASR